MAKQKSRTNQDVSKSWFCVFNNPEKHGYEGTPQEIVHALIETWIKDNPQRTCAVTYCISADGLKHCHAVFEDVRSMRFSAIKKIFPSMHISATKGSKEQAEDYINKRPPFDEQGEQVIYSNRHGEIKGRQGQRKDLDIIEELIQQGLTPDEVMDMSLQYRRFDKIIRDAYYRKRDKETPLVRDIVCYWHVGQSGAGKSYTVTKLAEIHGEHNIYLVGEYERGWDKYSGQPILFMDEFRGQLKYEIMLNILGGYKVQTHARYTNVIGLWNEVHITSVYPPDILYQNMIYNNRKIDTYEQLRRRIDVIVYHYKIDNQYFSFEMPMNEYSGYEQLKNKAHLDGKIGDSSINQSMFNALPADTPTPFDNDTSTKPTPTKAKQIPLIEN